MIALLLAIALQQDADALIRQLDDESPEVRERAAAQVKGLGEKVLPALKRSSNAHARSIAARIDACDGRGDRGPRTCDRAFCDR